MKGVQVQFEGIARFLDGRMDSPEQTWECFILNIEKMTLEMFKLVSIVFQQMDESIPRDVARTYSTAVTKLKEYYKYRPKFQIDKEEEYQPEYDEVSRYLDNKPEVITNDAARGELYKFLTLTEEKESNTRLLLESIPRFSYGNLQPIAKTQTMHRQNMLNFPNFNAKQTGSVQLRAPTGKGKKIQENVTEAQTQTDYDKATIKDIIAQFSKIHLTSSQSICDFSTEMVDFLQYLSENTGVIKEESVQVDLKSDGKKKKPKQTGKSVNSKKEIHEAVKKSDPSSDKLGLERSSIVTVDQGGREVESDANFENDKGKNLSKEANLSSSRFKNTKKQTEKARKAGSQSRKSQQFKKEVLSTKKEQLQQDKIQEEFVDYASKAKREKLQRDSSRKQSKKSQISRDKISSSREETAKKMEKVDEAYSTHHQKTFREKKEVQNDVQINRALPKIQEKSSKMNKKDRTDSFKKQFIDNSPYSKQFLQIQEGKMTKYSSLAQFNNRSLHMNSTHFMQKDMNRSLYKNQKSKEAALSLASLGETQDKNSFPHIQLETDALQKGWADKQENFLKQQNERLMHEIEQTTFSRRKKDFQELKVIKKIREYEILHARFCGENCIHLNKFYQFLKKKNLSMYMTRKELKPHKKNIEIGIMEH